MKQQHKQRKHKRKHKQQPPLERHSQIVEHVEVDLDRGKAATADEHRVLRRDTARAADGKCEPKGRCRPRKAGQGNLPAARARPMLNCSRHPDSRNDFKPMVAHLNLAD